MGSRRVRTPRVIQMEAVECGAASLAIILGYHGLFVSLEELRITCGVSRDGSDAWSLICAAKKYGLNGRGKKILAEDLDQIDLPAIVFWEYRHFLVLEGWSKKWVYLNDPASGYRRILREEFAKGYAGIVLEFESTADFKKGRPPQTFLINLCKKMKTIVSPLSFLGGISLFLLVPGLAMPAFSMFFISVLFRGNLLAEAPLFLFAVLVTTVISGLLTYFRYYFLNKLNGKLSLSWSSQFLWSLLRLPYSFYLQRHPGETSYRMTLNDSITSTLTGSILTTMSDLLLVIFFGLILFFYDWAIASFALFSGAVNLLMMLFITHSRMNSYARLKQNISKSMAESIGGLQTIEAIKVRSVENSFFAKWAGYFARNLVSKQEIGVKDAILSVVPSFFQFFSLAVLLTLGGRLILKGEMTVGMLMALQMLLSSFLQPINRFVGLSQTLQSVNVDLARLDDVLRHPQDPMSQQFLSPSNGNTPDRAGTKAPGLSLSERREASSCQLEGYLEFRNVSFGYNLQHEPLIENLNFSLYPGKRVALVGQTGSGKSTVAKLATGLLQPWSGDILYDHTPIGKVPLDLLRGSLAVVDQQIFLFAGTIREDLTLWNTQVPEENLVQAARDAQIHEEILLRPGGYETHLIEGGKNISGGQRQRLEICRTLLYNPSILILDEATSSLDSELEQLIMRQVIQRGCSVLMIAHRLSTVQECDEIIVLQRGKVVQRGTHQELKATPGYYHTLIEMGG